MAARLTAAGPIPVVPGKLYALGGTVSQRGDIHWVAPNKKQDAALNVYLLLDGDKGVLIDTSYQILERALLDQLKSFNISDLKIVFTRAVEFDSVGNADVLVEKFPVSEIWSHFTSYDWTFVRTKEPLPFPPPFESKMFGVDGTINIGKRELVTLGSPLRLLNAAWGYDAETKTLFTSDAFCHALPPEPGVQIVTKDNDTTTYDDVLAHLKQKFRWMSGANTLPIRVFVDNIFKQFDVENIAPTIGCMISGRELVQHHKNLMIEALLQLDGSDEVIK